MIDLPEEDEGKSGSPLWMATFADLMSLLMCFFVLLLSFSEMDAQVYKQIAGSMKLAFGVQNKIKAKAIPKGTSIIAREFSPGRPDPTTLSRVEQSTIKDMKQSLDVRVRPKGTAEHSLSEYADKLKPGESAQSLQEQMELLREQTATTARILRESLSTEILEGKIEVLESATVVTVRIREKGSFGSGSDQINNEFLPVMVTLRKVLATVTGSVAVEGHTDNIPISNARFRSNWDLSASRALSVAHELLQEDAVGAHRFMVIGYADSRPLVENNSSANRAVNRRVAIVMRHGLHDGGTDIGIEDAALKVAAENDQTEVVAELPDADDVSAPKVSAAVKGEAQKSIES